MVSPPRAAKWLLTVFLFPESPQFTFRVSVLSGVSISIRRQRGFFRDPWSDGAPLIGLHHLRP